MQPIVDGERDGVVSCAQACIEQQPVHAFGRQAAVKVAGPDHVEVLRATGRLTGQTPPRHVRGEGAARGVPITRAFRTEAEEVRTFDHITVRRRGNDRTGNAVVHGQKHAGGAGRADVFWAVVVDGQGQGVDTAAEPAGPRAERRSVALSEHPINAGGPSVGDGVAFRVGDRRGVQGDHGRGGVAVPLNREHRLRHLVVQDDGDRIGGVVAKFIPRDDDHLEGWRGVIEHVVEGPDEFFRARIRGIQRRKWAAVSIEFKAAIDDIAFGIDRARGVDGHRAGLWHHQFTPRIEVWFERQGEHWTQIDQFNDPAPDHAMRGIADLYADLVDAVAQRAAVRVLIAVHRKRRSLLRSAFPWQSGTGAARKQVAIDGARPFVGQRVVVHVPRCACIEQHLTVGREGGFILR